MLRVLSIFGTRPEAIKMAPVIKELARRSDKIESVTCSTGQHREMLQQVLDLFDIQPDHELHVMQPDQTLAMLTANLLNALDQVIQTTNPDWILAQGDTTSVLVASLLSFYHHIPFGHVEAGLRTGDKFRPFPEEVNRRVADLLADAYFAPTEMSKKVLLREEVAEEKIFVTGNTVVDALLEIDKKPFNWNESGLKQVPENERLVLITAHRRESFGEGFRQLCTGIQTLATRFPDVNFVYPVHLNPNVQQPVHELLTGYKNIILMEPVDYLSIVQLMKHATIILTDSGGIQEEAPTFHVPTLVMRDTTERPEGVTVGVARLVGTQHDQIVKEASNLLENEDFRSTIANKANPYGDGMSAARIVSILLGEPTMESISLQSAT